MQDEDTQMITIKGTKEGLTLFIEDTCSYEEVITQLKKRMKEAEFTQDEPIVPVHVKIGNRYLTTEQIEEVESLIITDTKFTVESLESNVVSKDRALAWLDESDVKRVMKVVRSGQVLSVTGDLLLLGDVNPGGKVKATGNIYVLGNLRGIAHAGSRGNQEAIIVASYMKPTQLRIAEYISRAPDYETDGVYMECGFIHKEEDKIMIDRLQTLSHIRTDIRGFERRMQNG